MIDIRLTSRLHTEIRAAVRVVVAQKMGRDIPRLEKAVVRAVWGVLRREHYTDLHRERARIQQRSAADDMPVAASGLIQKLTELAEAARNSANAMSQRGRWRMSIPARRDDSDIVIHDLAEAADEAALELSIDCACRPSSGVDPESLRAGVKMRALLEKNQQRGSH